MSAEIFGNEVQVVDSKIDPLTVIRQIIRNGQEDCFYVCDVNDIIEKHRNWVTSMPRIKTYYAMKCNDSRAVLETLAALGIGFDCASKGEIEKVLSLGVSPDRIIFANPTKKPSHIRYAAEVGVNVMSFHSEAELYKVKKEFPTANLILRICFDNPWTSFVVGRKYGADPKLEAENLLSLARSLSLNVIGVSFHISSNKKNEDYSVYAKAIDCAKNVFEMGSRMGYNFTLLDIGGGFSGEKNVAIDEIGLVINQALAQYFPDLSVKIIAEPGRYYVDSAFTLATYINLVKTIIKTDNEDDQIETKMYYVDTSMFGALLSTVLGRSYCPRPIYDDPKIPNYDSIVWGPTCHTQDKLCDNIQLPLMKIGDWMVFDKVGAYSLTLSCEFNGICTPNIHNIVNIENWKFLTEQVPYPISIDRYVNGVTPAHFSTGLNLSSAPNKYFFS